VFSRNVIYSAVGLLFAFFGVAAIYVLLGADFVAVAQILIYVGGILVLLIFGVMLSQKVTSVDIKNGAVQIVPAILVVGGVLFILIRVLLSTPWGAASGRNIQDVDLTAAVEPTTQQIGRLLMTEYLIPFEIVSVLLLGALIGAAFIARKDA